MKVNTIEQFKVLEFLKSNFEMDCIELESGKYVNPGLQVVCRLCKSLKTTPNDLINKDLWNWEEN